MSHKKQNNEMRLLDTREQRTHEVPSSETDGEDCFGAGEVVRELQNGGGGGRDPGALPTSVSDIRWERHEIGTRGGESRVAEEASELDLPLLSNGSRRLIHSFARYYCQSSRHFSLSWPLQFQFGIDDRGRT